jgi:pyruvate dehydrogenase E1 component alpha subunit
MLLIRRFEERLTTLTLAGTAPGLNHLSAGQEATAVGVCSALRDDDYLASNHRGNGHTLAKGARPDKLMAEVLGRRSGYCGGRSGSMHVFDKTTANLGTNGIVGGGVPLAAGAALAAKVRKTGQIAVCYFGDGALNQGLVPECMNMAAIWSLAVVFVCEHNGYGEFTASEDVTAGKDLLTRGTVFDIPSQRLDGMDVLAVREAADAAVARARAGGGPSFLLCTTYRYGGHHVADAQDYKDDDEAAAWRERDPIERCRRHLLEHGLAKPADVDAIDAAVGKEIEEAVAFATSSEPPEPATLRAFVYA